MIDDGVINILQDHAALICAVKQNVWLCRDATACPSNPKSLKIQAVSFGLVDPVLQQGASWEEQKERPS